MENTIGIASQAHLRWIFVLGVLISAASGPAFSQSCTTMPPASDFLVETLSTDVQGNAYDLAVAPDLKVYWIERFGNFKFYDPATGATRLINRFNVLYANNANYLGDVETGLEGLALDGNFAVNHWVYIWYSLPLTQLPALVGGRPGPIERLSRFTLTTNNTQINLASEKVIFEHTVFAQCCHFGGDLDWGPDGNLWLTTGDNMQWTLSTNDPFLVANENTDVRRTAGNTNDTRGKILRIRPMPFPDTQTPLPGIGTTYTIPAGNMREYFGTQGFWNSTEQLSVRPEIYSMGHRNPFSLAVHPTKIFPANGEAGWDNAANGEDEINVSPSPQNNGWPFFNGGNYNGTQLPSLNPRQTAAAPLNLSPWNTGLQKLPPATPAAISNRTAATTLGLNCLGTVLVWSHYDPALVSTEKFPPYLDGKLLLSSYGSVPLMAATINDSGRVTRMEQVLGARSELAFIHRSETGPDGALYIARGESVFGATTQSRIVKLSYVGTCAPVVPVRPKVSDQNFSHPNTVFHFGGESKFTWPVDAVRVKAYGLNGQLAWESKRNAPALETGHIPAHVKRGLLQLRFFND